jgi:PBCV-specific basic adaptor domain.
MIKQTGHEYVGDIIEFMNDKGEWSDRKLYSDSDGTLYVMYGGKKISVKQHTIDSVGYRFRIAK